MEIDRIIDNSCLIQQKMKIVIESNNQYVKEAENNQMLLEQEKRIINNLHGSMIKNYQEIVSEYQTASNEIKVNKQNKTLRNAEIVIGRKLQPNEKENIINDPKLIQEMLKSKLTEGASTKLINALSDLEDRHNDIVKLEKVYYLIY
jgi:hypothetical protein